MTHEELLKNIKANLPNLEKLLDSINGHWVYEDLIYRFYHHSFKTYHLQSFTCEIVQELRNLSPDEPRLAEYFEEIIEDGTGKAFEMKHNKEWTKHTRPMVEAFFHAKYALEMVVKYGRELDGPVELLPSGWAGIVSIFKLRYGK